MDFLYFGANVDHQLPASEGPLTELAKQGPLGLLCVFLIFALIIVWRKLLERDATIAALQEARVQAMQKQTEALVSATTAMNKQAETGDETNVLLRQIASDYQQRRGRP